MFEPGLYLSIYTDASWGPKSKHGTWGAWMRDEKKRVIARGLAPEWTRDWSLT